MMNIFEIIEKYFCCPTCKGTLRITRINRSADGLLQCVECQHRYFVLDNIPVMLPYGYVETDIKQQFLSRYPHYRGLFDDIPTTADDPVKRHQISTWGTQYKHVTSGSEVQRTIPQTTDVTLINPLYKNSRELLRSIVSRKTASHNNEAFLDIGCGRGTFTHLGNQHFQLYFGMDISFDAIAKNLRTLPFKNCIFFVGDAEDIPLRNSSVDVCAAQWLFEHLGNPSRCAREMFRVLASNGVAYVDTNHKAFMLTYRWFQLVFSPEQYWGRMEQAGHCHDRFFSRNGIHNIFEQAGFKRIRTKLCYFMLDMLIFYKVYDAVLRWIRRFSAMSIKGHVEVSMKNKSVVGLVDFDRKEDFARAVGSTRSLLKKAFNGIVLVMYYCLFVDRLLELCGKGESVILLAEKINKRC